jgi:branched-chain amino acid transport system ATP-binding protein
MSTPALQTTGLRKNFGALVVANDIEFRLEPGARHALIGPNGAGKTTFINLITGRLMPSAGRILLGGEDITELSQAERVKRGLGRTFQINTLFKGLSVLENVCLAVGEREGQAGQMFRLVGSKRAVIEEAYALLERLRIADDALLPVKELPYGKQRLVEIAIALGLKPKVLLLDEPAAGLGGGDMKKLAEVLIDLRRRKVALVVIEHHMDLIMSIADRIVMIDQGRMLAMGTPTEIQRDARVREAYLGRDE